MKTKVNLRTDSDSVAGGDQNGRGKRLLPEKKEKNVKRILYQEIEEDDEIDYLNIKQKSDSLEYYFDDDEDDDDEYLDDDEYDDEYDEEEEKE